MTSVEPRADDLPAIVEPRADGLAPGTGSVLGIRPPRWVTRRLAAGVVLASWIPLAVLLHGRATLPLGGADTRPLHDELAEAAGSIDAHRNDNPFFLYFINYLRQFLDWFVEGMQGLISQPSFGRPVPVLGWLGVVAIAAGVAWLFGNVRVALLAAAGFCSFGVLGLWQESMDTLALTLTAVLLSLAAGIPLGIWAGLSDRVHRAFQPVLDFMQTMPTLVYLAPIALFFSIGPASAVVATMVYAVPPTIRLTDHAIRQVPFTTVEAGTALGSTSWQLLFKVRLPQAQRTVLVGVNQTMMAALSMATIAALIDAPGLGQTILKALQSLDVGTAFNAGLAIVIMAIVLDRVTTAASGSRFSCPTPKDKVLIGAVLATMAALAYLSHTYVWAATFDVDANYGPKVRKAADETSAWVQEHLFTYTDALKDALTYGLLNPFEGLLAESPWWLTACVAVALAALVSTRNALGVAAGIAALLGLGLWQDSMVTLASTLVGTVLVMMLGVVLGVWMGRSERVDGLLRPVLDAAQNLPAFVYIVPIVGLFGATRFTAIVAAVAYAAPVAVKIVADGIRGVPEGPVEAATAAGSSTWQLIWKVQLPMARGSVGLAANQGLCYVLAMVVVGGLVGAGALGYDVVAGFSQLDLKGKGLAAGVAIVVLGLLLQRGPQSRKGNA